MLSERLAAREAEGRPIQIALVGCGHIGTSIVNQTSQIAGMRVAVIAEPVVEKAEEALRANGVERPEVVGDAYRVVSRSEEDFSIDIVAAVRDAVGPNVELNHDLIKSHLSKENRFIALFKPGWESRDQYGG